MLAICAIQGKQYTVEKGQSILVDLMPQDVGSKVTIDTVLSVVDGKKSQFGTPYLPDVRVEAEVEDHVKGTKIIVFKRRRRKDSKKKQGHRHQYTQLKITAIGKKK